MNSEVTVEDVKAAVRAYEPEAEVDERIAQGVVAYISVTASRKRNQRDIHDLYCMAKGFGEL